MVRSHMTMTLLAMAVLVPGSVRSMSYPKSVAAVTSLDTQADSAQIRGTVELRGVPPGSIGKLLMTVRVNGTRAGRDKDGHIKVSDNSMDVATPSARGNYALALEKQQLWLLEATADGFETAAVIVSGSAIVDFVLVPQSPRN